MKILFISAFPPNQKTAGQYYTLRLLQDLISRGNIVDLYYFDYPNHPCEFEGRKLIPTFINSLKSPFFFPFFTKRFNINILRSIQNIAGKYDMLYFDFTQVHIYSLFVRHPYKVLMCHDIIAQKSKRQWPLFFLWIKYCEKKILKSGKLLLTFSQKDTDILHNIYKLDSVPVNFYLKPVTVFDSVCVEDKLFCFYGAWNRGENIESLIWFVDNVLPLISSDYKFNVIGGGMPELIRIRIEKLQNFKYLGFVDNPSVEIMKCQALIAPLHEGAGVKVKVIDSLSTGTKVIGTEVAFEGIEDNKNNKLFYKASTPLEFSNILMTWNTVTEDEKKLASEEFIQNYNKNHFPDMI